MKCIRCGHDSTYPQRQQRVCPGCRGTFAFEPRTGDPVTDMLFYNAIRAVSGEEGGIRWGIEHLYYEVCRRKRWKIAPFGVVMVLLAVCVFMLAMAAFTRAGAFLWVGLVVGGFTIAAAIQRSLARRPTLAREKFDELWRRWLATHGMPAGVIIRRAATAQPAAEPDLGDYSFDRAVICDRARTADLLLANNFHFENNCAVLTIDGYPSGPFETVRQMLKRNPRLQVFALHDATVNGCRLAHHLATDPTWFAHLPQVVDVGLRPRQATGPYFRGLALPGEGVKVSEGEGISAAEAEWLARNQLELAAVRPELVLKRLFRALNRVAPADATAAARGDGAAAVVYDDSFDHTDPRKQAASGNGSGGGFDAFG